jgi:hypothetical protein
VGPDEVAVTGVRGDPPPATTKVALTYQGGWRTTVSLMLTGLDIEEKAALAERALWASIPGGKASFAGVDVAVLRTDRPDPPSNEAAMAELRITVRDPDEAAVGRRVTAAVTELALANYPGFLGGPSSAGSYGVYWPTVVPASAVPTRVDVDGVVSVVDPVIAPASWSPVVVPRVPVAPAPGGFGVPVPLGRLFGARSGDKGGNANVGVWARSPEAFAWLSETLTVDGFQALLPDTADLPVVRYDLANLWALNFVVIGLLGEGVASSSRVDPQAKSLGEYLRAKVVEVPERLL